jgi:Rps23 Pro-64 3,4-dihydroxylase Tpa1-like proline 4-hydroxylase
MVNPDLDLAVAAADFRRDSRLLIPDFLSLDAADALHACLESAVPWGLTYRDQGQPIILQAEALRGLTAEERIHIRLQAETDARQGFAFLYGTYMMVSAYRERRDPGLLLHRMVEFLNTPAFLGVLTTITGIRSIVKANAQATRYEPGHFLTYHDDQRDSVGREVAYVLNLTRDWREEWGGALHFSDAQGKVSERYLPRFNSLALFRVPTGHFVSKVSDDAPRPRYAITGWALNR